MSIVTDLYATLNADAGVRAIVGLATSPQQSKIYPNNAPESAAVPLITYSMVTGTRIDTLPGVGDMERQLIQINCVQSTPELAHALADAVYSALEGNGWQSSKNDIYDIATQSYMVALDWTFYA
jgi:hypothetical protein